MSSERLGEATTSEATKAGSLTEDGRERELDILIARRSQQIGDPEYESRRWQQSLDRYNMRAALERREAWRRFHERLAATHQQIAAHHEQAAQQLAAGG